MGDARLEQKLALHGSQKAVTRIEGRGKPKIGVEEFMSLAERFGFSRRTLRQIRAAAMTEDWGEGPFLGNYYSGLTETKVQAFERTARNVFDVPYAIGLSSGTAALHSAFVAVGTGAGTEVITSAIGFYATAAAIVMAHGVPVFCDVDASMHMDPSTIESLITERTVAIAPTHVMGGVCNMEAIMKVARKHKLKVVEDCAQACGAKYRGRLVGTFGDIGCFSISSYKIVGGGEGGLLITQDERLWERASQLAECGGLWRPDRFAPPRYEGELFNGTNYRMSELEAAVDVVQMRRMPETARRSAAVKRRVLRALKRFREIVPQHANDPDGELGYRLAFYPETMELGQKIVEALNAEGVSCGMRGRDGSPDWHIYHDMFPITMRAANGPDCSFACPHYTSKGGRADYGKGNCPVADDLFDRSVRIALNQWHTARDCANIAKAINKVLAAYCTEDAKAAPWF